MIRIDKNDDLCDKITGLLFLIGGGLVLAGAVGFIIWGSVESFVFVMDGIKRIVWGR